MYILGHTLSQVVPTKLLSYPYPILVSISTYIAIPTICSCYPGGTPRGDPSRRRRGRSHRGSRTVADSSQQQLQRRHRCGGRGAAWRHAARAGAGRPPRLRQVHAGRPAGRLLAGRQPGPPRRPAAVRAGRLRGPWFWPGRRHRPLQRGPAAAGGLGAAGATLRGAGRRPAAVHPRGSMRRSCRGSDRSPDIVRECGCGCYL